MKQPVLKDHQELLPDRGVYDKRNWLNDKTGREWRFATKSVVPREFDEHVIADLRVKYPQILPTELAKNLIETFTKGGNTILDPFAGFGNFLFAASQAKTASSQTTSEKYRDITGIWYSKTMNEAYIRRYKTVSGGGEQKFFTGKISDYAAANPDSKFDFIITEIPIVKEQGNDDLAIESFIGKDNSVDIERWQQVLSKKLSTAWNLLELNHYMALIVPLDWFWQKMANKISNFIDLSYIIIKATETCNAVLKSEISWFKDPNPGDFTSEVRKKILVFRKEKE